MLVLTRSQNESIVIDDDMSNVNYFGRFSDNYVGRYIFI